MDKLNVLALIGGISKNSLNKSLYNEILKHNPTSIVFDTFDIAQLPFFSQDIERDFPEVVGKFKEKVKNADGILFITPEYNRSFPGVLKNAIDWCSRPAGENLWSWKPTGLMGASGGKIGTFGAQTQLRNVCFFLNMQVMNYPEFYFDASTGMNEDKTLTENSVKYLNRYLLKFEEWIKKHQEIK